MTKEETLKELENYIASLTNESRAELLKIARLLQIGEQSKEKEMLRHQK